MHRVHDARLRPGQRRLRERVLRLDGVRTRCSRWRASTGSRPRWRACGAVGVRASTPRTPRACPARRRRAAPGRARGVLVLLGVLRRDRRARLRRSCTWSERLRSDELGRLVARAVAGLRGGRRGCCTGSAAGAAPPAATSLRAARVRRRPADDRGGARLADRRLRRPAVLGPHAPARAAADGGAAADPARAALAADVAGAAAPDADAASGARSRGRAGPRRCARWPARSPPGSCSTPPSSPGTSRAPTTRRCLRAVHDVEHAMFFFTGLLFWARVIDPGPLRPRLVWPARIALRGRRDGRRLGAGDHAGARAASAVSALRRRWRIGPGGITALTDQQLAGGMMWVPGSIAYTITFMIGFYRWLEPESKPRPPSDSRRRCHERDLAHRRTDRHAPVRGQLPGRLAAVAAAAGLPADRVAVWYVAFARRTRDAHPSSPVAAGARRRRRRRPTTPIGPSPPGHRRARSDDPGRGPPPPRQPPHRRAARRR